MSRFLRPLNACVLLGAAAALATFGFEAAAQGPPGLGPDIQQLQNKFKTIQWQRGPTKGRVGSLAEVVVPQGFKFADRRGLLTLLELTQNTTSERDLAVICPEHYDVVANPTWFLTFEWDGIGKVDDTDKANLDAAALLEGITSGQEQDNQNRTAHGMPTLKILGWAKPPFYDPQTNLLTWGTRISSGNSPRVTVNYNSRILGREGVMSANLVIDENDLERELDTYRQIVKGFSYLPGKKYAEWQAGDKVAGLGLTALVTGGAAAVAAKTGLLGKLGKGIVYIVVAVVAGIGGLIKKLFGSRESAA